MTGLTGSKDPAAAFVADACMPHRFSLSEVLHKNNVTIQRVQLCVKDCPFVRRDGQSRCLSGRTVLKIEDSRSAMGSEVEERDSGSSCCIEIINAIVYYGPIPPITCF